MAQRGAATEGRPYIDSSFEPTTGRDSFQPFKRGVAGTVEREDLIKLAECTGLGPEPEVTLIKRAGPSGKRLGVFSSSFNPLTIAHLEVMRAAAEGVGLDEVLALAGKTNADKSDYDCPLEVRIEMLLAGLSQFPNMSVGLSSSAFFVDKVDSLARHYPARTEIFFIVGFDTFERVLDSEDRYTTRYHRRFRGPADALNYLLSRSHLIVAGRLDKGREEVRRLVEREAAGLSQRIIFLEPASELRDRSAGEVRCRIEAGLPVNGLVPEAVERYIDQHGLYKRIR